MSHLPLPVRVAVGLALTAVEQARKLPEQLADLPVTAASRAVQAGMRVQQRVTELAIKGDEVFSLFRPVEDTPPWATFDEDEQPQRPEANSAGVPAPGSVPVAGEFDEADIAQALTPPHPTATTARPDPNLTTSA
ncbi:MAG: lipid droplet-associated protein, partial [Pseudonocardiaceae bacterium]